MSDRNAKEFYDALVGQIAKEDDLYFKRMTLSTTITGAFVTAILIAEISNVELVIIYTFVIGLTYFINLQIDEGRFQLQNLKKYYFENIDLIGKYPCPFFSRGMERDLRKPGTSRITKGIYATWVCLLFIAIVRFFWN